ncbi:hypothetical protein QDR37_06110 [Amnibacterium sp. CER49]|uniref:hypothetical protein n=1 Tax=Amnibacterium sp. CER49 TaxID=3039161 RepID=UPI00244C9670|nr:hypothetical protein [Amnibacterium sp. CER49]MDH2443514.1 hypothetical protein [Amnibacterium sp. CER49]
MIELSWQPRFVREAVAVLAGSARHWTYISSRSVYARQDLPLASEAAEPHAPLDADEADALEYGPAKAACEALSVAALAGRLLRVRPGLIGGPGDPTGRSTYWVTRAALAPTRPMLAPKPAGAPTQIIDVRDLAAWLLAAGADGLTGAFNAVGPTMALADWIALSRLVGRHRSWIEWADPELLLASGVEQFAGDRSLPLWIAEPSLRCFFLRDGSAAERQGLRHRPRVQMLTDALVRAGAHQPAAPGPALTLEQEQGILQQLAAWREHGADKVPRAPRRETGQSRRALVSREDSPARAGSRRAPSGAAESSARSGRS